jgi:hypothetical protein
MKILTSIMSLGFNRKPKKKNGHSSKFESDHISPYSIGLRHKNQINYLVRNLDGKSPLTVHSNRIRPYFAEKTHSDIVRSLPPRQKGNPSKPQAKPVN